jgi:hypothetical protein
MLNSSLKSEFIFASAFSQVIHFHHFPNCRQSFARSLSLPIFNIERFIHFRYFIAESHHRIFRIIYNCHNAQNLANLSAVFFPHLSRQNFNSFQSFRRGRIRKNDKGAVDIFNYTNLRDKCTCVSFVKRCLMPCFGVRFVKPAERKFRQTVVQKLKCFLRKKI